MTVLRHRVFGNTYHDSVALLAMSAKVAALPGVEAASIVMGTPANRTNLRDAGLDPVASAGPNDLVVALRAAEEATAAEAFALAEQLLAARTPATSGSQAADRRPASLVAAVDKDPLLNLALISVPGDYAAAEAVKALNLGLHVMIFSDNVPAAREREIKELARERGLLVMGPDCGTALVNGVPLGFANAVRRGPIGVVGASGTGMQEIISRAHRLGSGISQALGTGGHDLAEEIGGISMLTALAALAGDPATQVIVLASKPPSDKVASVVLARAREVGKPVVVVFLGADPATLSAGAVRAAGTLAEAADLAVALAGGESPGARRTDVDPADRAMLAEAGGRLRPGQRYLRGLFAGGTFCFEAQLVCRARGVPTHSNTPVPGGRRLPDPRRSREHTVVDLGDDQFTRGRPHPMIDPTYRNERIRQEILDPEVAVLLLDVVLGHGAAPEPLTGLLAALAEARRDAGELGQRVAVVASVCGTDEDPQRRASVVSALRAEGVLVAGSNAEAAGWAAGLIPAGRSALTGQRGA